MNSDHFLAMKEVSKQQFEAKVLYLHIAQIKSSLPLIAGTTATEKSASIGKIMNEVNISREQVGQYPSLIEFSLIQVNPSLRHL